MKRRPMTDAKRTRVLRALGLRAHSVPELAAIADVRGETVRDYLAPLRATGLVHLSEWLDRRTPLFIQGRGRDAVRPKPLTAAQRMAKSRANKEKT